MRALTQTHTHITNTGVHPSYWAGLPPGPSFLFQERAPAFSPSPPSPASLPSSSTHTTPNPDNYMLRQHAHLLRRSGTALALCSSRRALASKANTTSPPSSSSSSSSSTEHHNALSATIKRLKRKHGQGALMRLGDTNPPFPIEDVISTGSLALDHALGIGGLPRGSIVEMSGPQRSGKTTVALHVIAEAQKRGGTCVFVNTEQALDPAYARRLGVDVENLLVSQPDDGEQGFDITEQLVKSRVVDCIIIDSWAALMPEVEIERDVGDDYRAWQGRVLSQAFRRLKRSAAKSKCLLLFLHQTGSHNDSGETALRLQSSVRLAFGRGQKLRSKTREVGCRTLVKVVKNKFARPFGTAEFDVLFESGIDRLDELIDLGVTLGRVEKKRAWFVLKAQAGEEIGREGVMLEKAVREKLEGMDSYLDTTPASSSTSFGEGEEEEEGREGEVRNLTETAADAEAAMDEAEQERDGAYAFPRDPEEKEERKDRRRMQEKESSDSSYQERTTMTRTRMMDPIEHFGAGAGGEGVDLEIDYMTGEIGNAEAAAAAAAAAARQKREGEGGGGGSA